MANLTRSRGVYGLVGQLNHHLLNNQSCSSLGLRSKLPFLPNSSNAYPMSTHLRKAFAMPACNSFLLSAKTADNGRFCLDQQFRSIANKGYTKQFKGTSSIKGVCDKANPIAFGEYALQIIEPARITEKQIKAGRLALTRTARRGGKLWVRVHPNKPVTAKPVATRMGRGKGALAYWAAIVKPGRVLYEMSGVNEDTAKRAMEIAASKLPMRTRFIKLDKSPVDKY